MHGLAVTAGLDELEFVRGAITAFSCRPDLSAREVHVGRISKLLEQAGLSHALDSSLETLNRLREVQPLDRGYILPTPIRCVELAAGHDMVIAVHPTQELCRHFGSVTRIGAGRVLASDKTLPLTRQSLGSWMGADGRTAAVWAQAEMLGAKAALSPSVVEDSLQAFAIKKMPGRSACGLPSWVSTSSEDQARWQGVSLFRAPNAGRSYRYFFARVGTNGSMLEGPKVQQHLRIRFGLAALIGARLAIEVVVRSDRTAFKLPLPPPPAERRLLIALCKPAEESGGYAWSCPTESIWPIVKDGLLNLGCEFIEHG